MLPAPGAILTLILHPDSSPRHSLFLSLPLHHSLFLIHSTTLSFSLSSTPHSLFLSFSPSSRQEFKNRARSLEYLSGIITDLFVDWHRLRGVDSRRKIGDLQRAIMASGDDFDGLINSFFTLPNAPSQSHNRWGRGRGMLIGTLYFPLNLFYSATYRIRSILILFWVLFLSFASRS